jgi:hypothetical protein
MIEPLCAAHQPRMALQRGRAAGAVAAQQRDHLAAVHREVDAVQDVRLAVPGVQVGQAQQLARRGPSVLSHGRPAVHCAPWFFAAHVGLAAPAGSSTPGVGPSAITAPRASTVMVSAMLETDVHVVLDHQHRAVGRHLLDQLRDELDVLVAHALRGLVEQHHLRVHGQRGGDLQRALAAVGQLDVTMSAKSRRPTVSSSSQRASLSCVEQAALGAPEVERHAQPRCSATRTFSSTVRCGKVAEIWNERMTPRRAICAGFSFVMSWPSNRICRAWA